MCLLLFFIIRWNSAAEPELGIYCSRRKNSVETKIQIKDSEICDDKPTSLGHLLDWNVAVGSFGDTGSGCFALFCLNLSIDGLVYFSGYFIYSVL